MQQKLYVACKIQSVYYTLWKHTSGITELFFRVSNVALD